MADNIIGYLKKTKDETFEEVPFNEVDSLILSQFSYLKFGGMVPALGEMDESVSLQDIADSELYETLYEDERYKKNNKALFEGMLNSNRFNQIRIHSYVNIIDYENESQFAAIVVELPTGISYVAFRGTDENLVGWKEDFNMSLSKPVPGQIKSVDYLFDVSGYISEKFYIGGHSKGGNLAVFSAMYAHESIQERIISIFNHDGPGMRNEIMNESGYLAIRDRICMTVPHSSLIGMLLINYDNYKVVDSKMPGISGILQHDPFSWKVKGHDFVLREELRQASAIKDRSINEWVMSLDDDQIETFLAATNDMMAASGVDNLNDMMTEWKSVLKNISVAMKDMDEETKAILTKVFQALIEIADTNTKAEVQEKIVEVKDYTSNLMTEMKDASNKLMKPVSDIVHNAFR